jgi:hypothetical protein
MLCLIGSHRCEAKVTPISSVGRLVPIVALEINRMLVTHTRAFYLVDARLPGLLIILLGYRVFDTEVYGSASLRV